MNEPVISVRDLRKVYRLYTTPRHKFLDMVGLLRTNAVYKEHAALDGVTLDIAQGEKVAIIGRNGAGKSTFLKLVTKVTEPTSGTLTVRGRVHALLQLGAGFHPDFTGRENVYAYLAQLGMSGRKADDICDEIVGFAEIEEYIDQPVKTYSTGMAVRLVFATTTAISPDLLVLDEVLSVGDAYFSQKSYLRMQELCDRHGTTLLFVTHDIFAAVRMCPRIVWFDSGRVVMDGDGETVVKAYDESIRAQEESRLRKKQWLQLQPQPADREVKGRNAHLLFEIQAAPNQPQPAPVSFARIALLKGSDILAELPLTSEAFEGAKGSHLVREGSNWGEISIIGERTSRTMLNYGSPFHKVTGVFAISSEENLALQDLAILIEYFSAKSCRLHLLAHVGNNPLDFGWFDTQEGAWSKHTAVLLPKAEQVSTFRVGFGVQGSGHIVLTGFSMFNSHGKDVTVVRHGEPVTFRCGFRILNPNLCERAEAIVIISRNGTERVCKFMTKDLLFDSEQFSEGVIEMRVPKMMLGAGEYSVAIEVAAEGYVERGMNRYFSIDPEVYHCLTHALDFVVSDSGWIQGAVFEGYADWNIERTPQ